jgi:hypothetical protein
MSSGNGNLLGGRSWHRYVSDAGTQYSVFLDDDLGIAGGFLRYPEGNVSDPEFPKRWRMRYLTARTSSGQNKSIPMATLSQTAYDTDSSSSIAVATVLFQVTGRVGEKARFPTNKAAASPD